LGLWDSFMGKDQQKDLSAANELSQQRIVGGLTDYTNTSKEYLDKSLGFLQPGIESGNRTLSLLGDILGLNGRDAQSRYFTDFQTDPGFMASQDAGIKAADRSAAARGLVRSGGQQRSLFDFGQQNMAGQYQNRIGSLFGLLPAGMGAANTAAGLTSQTGTGIADAQFGTGQLLANQATNYGNAMAQSRGTGINNILGFGNMFANILGGLNGGGGGGGNAKKAASLFGG
jgi:hypothetical protein